MNISSRVFVTGATGFIGSNLSAALHDRHVHVLARAGADLTILSSSPKVTIHRYDGTTQSVIDAFNGARPELVIHLAACFVAEHESDDIERLIESNILLGAQVLEGMLVTGARALINTGTSWQHFEDDERRSVCFYAATKQAFESLIDFYVDAYSFRAATLKLFDTYGPGDRRPKLFNLLHGADASKPLLMSEGRQLIDLVYIDDVVRAFLAAEEHVLSSTIPVHERFGVSSGDPRPLREVVERFLHLARSKVTVEWGVRPYRTREVMRPWTHFRSVPRWNPRISLDEGFSRILNLNEGGPPPDGE